MLSNSFQKLWDLRYDLDQIIINLEGEELEYKGNKGTIICINNDRTALISFKNESGYIWEESFTWLELALNLKC